MSQQQAKRIKRERPVCDEASEEHHWWKWNSILKPLENEGGWLAIPDDKCPDCRGIFCRIPIGNDGKHIPLVKVGFSSLKEVVYCTV